MSNNYETVCIVKPDVGDDVIKGVIQKATSAVESGGGKVNKLEEWGRKRLAYPIQKKNEGYYFVLDYTSPPEASKEVGRLLRLNEEVLRHQTIRKDEPAKPAAPAAAAPAGTETAAKGGQDGTGKA